MKKLLLATVSMVALTSAARAADMPAAMPAKERMYSPVPVATWVGGYVGVQGGLVQRDTSFVDGGFFTGANSTTRIDERKTGAAVGGLLGYNWQQGSFVYGVEGDWNWTSAKTSQFTPTLNGNINEDLSTNWLATLRGRVGLAFDSTLLYVTGGAAFGHAQNSVELVGTGGAAGRVASFTQNQTRVGWSAGAGVEHMLTQHWTVRAEFRYADLGKTSVACAVTGGADFNNCVKLGYRGEFSNTLMLGLVGLAYKF